MVNNVAEGNGNVRNSLANFKGLTLIAFSRHMKLSINALDWCKNR